MLKEIFSEKYSSTHKIGRIATMVGLLWLCLINIGNTAEVDKPDAKGTKPSNAQKILDRPLRVLTTNIYQYAATPDERMKVMRRQIEQLDPDLIAFQEAGWRPKERHQVDLLLDGLNYHLDHEYDGSDSKIVQGGGIAVASRWPIRRIALEVLPHARVLAEEVSAPVPGGKLTFCALFGTKDWQLNNELMREKNVVALERFVTKVCDPTGMPPIIGGDFDAVPDSASIRFLTGKQSLEGISTHYYDAWAMANKHSDDPGYTWTSANPLVRDLTVRLLRDGDHHRRIDYIFVGSPHVYRGYARIVSAKVALNEPEEGVYPSDHYGVFAEIAVTPE